MSSERRERFEAKLRADDAGAITDNLYKGMERMLASYDAEILETDANDGPTSTGRTYTRSGAFTAPFDSRDSQR